MKKHDSPLILKFTGIDDEITSKEDIKERKDTQIYTPDSTLLTCNGGHHNLAVNNCFGNKKFYVLFRNKTKFIC